MEDEKAVLRTLICRILEQRGYTAREAESELEALDIAGKYNGAIHLAITDMVMPGLGGRETVFRLEIERSGIQALYFSGHTDSSPVHHGILNSGVYFLRKPFTAGGPIRSAQAAIGGNRSGRAGESLEQDTSIDRR